MSGLDEEHPTLRGPGPMVRPYFLTGGRTTSIGEDLPMESLVMVKLDDGSAVAERREILDACAEPIAIAEIAARVRLPLGVARVLVSDLAALGVVEVCQTVVEGDLDAIRRLMAGVRAL